MAKAKHTKELKAPNFPLSGNAQELAARSSVIGVGVRYRGTTVSGLHRAQLFYITFFSKKNAVHTALKKRQ